MENTIIKPSDYPLNTDAFGRVKIWKFRPDGYKQLIVNQPNLIVNQGADIMANAIVGTSNSAINYFYIGYATGTYTPPTPAIGDTCASFSSTGNYGYLRLPLAFPASYLNETGYANNAPYFTTFITSGSAAYKTGAAFTSGVSTLFSLGLVNAPAPSDHTQDRLFSEITFGPITYDSTYGLAITWGVTFRVTDPSA